MSETITPQRFHEFDWRVIRDAASTHFRTGSFAKGLALVDAIGELAEAANHHPDIDLRYRGVTVRLKTHSEGGLTERDVALARQISDAARELEIPIDLTGLQTDPGRDRCARDPRGAAVLARRARLQGRG